MNLSNTGELREDNAFNRTAADEPKIGAGWRAVAIRLPSQLGVYKVGPELGRGGMGVVYLATELGLNRQVALKILPFTSHLRAADIQRFHIEAQAAAQLNHDNIVPIYHIGQEEEIHYYAMKLIDGSDLSHLIKQARLSVQSTRRASRFNERTDKLKDRDQISTQRELEAQPETYTAAETKGRSLSGAFAELSGASFSASMERQGHKSAEKIARTVALIGEQVAEALSHSHQRGVIHRDIKPSNLLLDDNNRVWVTDFGLAHLQNAPALTRTGDLVGTLRYMSPEQASGRRGLVDHRTDIYSLGITLYELVTLQQACRGHNAQEIIRELTFERPAPIRKINPRLPRDFETIICRATERNPADRYQSAADLAADLRRFIDNELIETPRTPKWKHARDWLYERPRVAFSITTFLLTLITVLSFGAWALQSRATANMGRRRQAESTVALSQDKNPGRALALGLEAAKYTPGFAADQTILAALESLREVRRIDLGDSKPGRLVFSPDGELLLKCVDPQFHQHNLGQAVVFDADTGEQVARLDNKQRIITAAFSPDGTQLVTSGAFYLDTAVDDASRLKESRSPPLVWSVSDFGAKPLALVRASALRLSAAVFSNLAARAVFPAAEGNEALVISTQDWSRNVMKLAGGHSKPVIEAIYSPDGKFIATWSEDGTAVLWDSELGSQLKVFRSDDGNMPYKVNLSFSSDSRELMLRGWKGIQTYSTDTLAKARYFREMHGKFASFDDRVFAKGFVGDSILVYGAFSDHEVAKCYSDEPLEDFVCVGRNQTIAAIPQRDSFIRLYSSYDGSLQAECRGHTDWIRDIQSRPKSEQFATISWDDTIRIWNSTTNADSRTIGGGELKLSEPALSHAQDGQRAIVSTVSGFQASLRGLSEGHPLIGNFRGQVKAMLQNGRFLIEEPGRIAIVDAVTSRLEVDLLLPNEQIREAVELPDGKGILIITDSRRLLHWSIADRRLVALSEVGESVVDLAIAPPAGKVLAGMQNGQLVQFDPQNRMREQMASFNSAILDLDFDSTHQRLLITTEDQRAMVWDPAEKKEIVTITSNAFPISKARFALDGDHIVTHAGDRTLRLCLWNLENQELVSSLEIRQVRDFDASQDRRRFAIASAEQGGLIWDVASDERFTVTELSCHKIRFAGEQLIIATTPRIAEQPRANVAVAEKSLVASLLIWDYPKRAIVFEQFLGIRATAFHVDPQLGRFAVSGISTGAAVIDIDSQSAIQRLLGHSERLMLASFNSDERFAVTVSIDGTILVHDLARNTQELVGRHDYRVTAAAISPDRKHLVTSDASGLTYHWNLDGRERVREMAAPSTNMWAVQHVLGDDNIQVVSLFAHDTIGIWDLRSGKPSYETVKEGVHTLSLAPDGSEVLALIGSRRGSVSGSRKEDGVGSSANTTPRAVLIRLDNKSRRTIPLDEQIATGQFLPDGRHLAFLTRRGVILILDAETLQTLHTINTEPRCLGLLSASLEDHCLYVRMHDGYQGWDWISGEQLFGVFANPVENRFGMLQSWSVEHEQSTWRLLHSNDSIIKVPRQPVRYASELAPWSLEQN